MEKREELRPRSERDLNAGNSSDDAGGGVSDKLARVVKLNMSKCIKRLTCGIEGKTNRDSN